MPRSALSHQYSKRLQRLLVLVNEIKTNPCQTPEALWASLGVSRAMLYKDRQALATISFTFHYDRRQRGYIITQDRFLPVLNLSVSEVLALIMAVRQLSSSGDYTLTYEAIAALRKVLSNMPADMGAVPLVAVSKHDKPWKGLHVAAVIALPISTAPLVSSSELYRKSKTASEAITTAAQGLHHRAAHRSPSQEVAREAVRPVCQCDGPDLNCHARLSTQERGVPPSW